MRRFGNVRSETRAIVRHQRVGRASDVVVLLPETLKCSDSYVQVTRYEHEVQPDSARERQTVA